MGKLSSNNALISEFCEIFAKLVYTCMIKCGWRWLRRWKDGEVGDGSMGAESPPRRPTPFAPLNASSSERGRASQFCRTPRTETVRGQTGGARRPVPSVSDFFRASVLLSRADARDPRPRPSVRVVPSSFQDKPNRPTDRPSGGQSECHPPLLSLARFSRCISGSYQLFIAYAPSWRRGREGGRQVRQILNYRRSCARVLAPWNIRRGTGGK